MTCDICNAWWPRGQGVLTDVAILAANGGDLMPRHTLSRQLSACAACIDATVYLDGAIGTVTALSDIVIYER